MQFDTHFESGIGVGIHGEMKKGDVTIVKVGSSLKRILLRRRRDFGESIPQRPLPDPNRRADGFAPVTYFLKSSLGNHHQVIYGHHKAELKAYFESLVCVRSRADQPINARIS
jgi:hypothetical protein